MTEVSLATSCLLSTEKTFRNLRERFLNKRAIIESFCEGHSTSASSSDEDCDSLSINAANAALLRYKTELCRNFEMKGNCNYGKKC